MGVYIKLDMPKSCSDCFAERCIGSDFGCDIIGFEDGNTTCFTRERRKDCPLVEVPPHGRLIDADAAYNQFLNLMDIQGAINPCQLGTILTDAPTLIESEEDE